MPISAKNKPDVKQLIEVKGKPFGFCRRICIPLAGLARWGSATAVTLQTLI